MFGLFRRRGGSDGMGVPGRLTGVFDIRGQVASGYVEAIPEVSNAGTRVDVWRGHILVASAEAEKLNEHGRLRFQLPFEGRFTVEDLIRERVKLVACNARGDTGPIGLDGATQMELIRDYMGTPVETVIDLSFARGGNAKQHLGTGWSGREADFTWTLDDDSLIYFPSPVRDGHYSLRLRAGAFITPLATAQKLDIYINDDLIGAIMADAPTVQFEEFRFSGKVFTKPRATVRLHHPLAGRPSEHFGTGDSRRIAFAVRRISVVRVLEGNTSHQEV